MVVQIVPRQYGTRTHAIPTSADATLVAVASLIKSMSLDKVNTRRVDRYPMSFLTGLVGQFVIQTLAMVVLNQRRVQLMSRQLHRLPLVHRQRLLLNNTSVDVLRVPLVCGIRMHAMQALEDVILAVIELSI